MKKLSIAIALSLACVCSEPIAYAAAGQTGQVMVVNFGDLVGYVSTSIYRPMMEFLSNSMWLGFDPKLVPILLKANQERNQAQNDLNDIVGATVSSAVDLDFSDNRLKKDNIRDLVMLEAGDDNPTTSYGALEQYYRKMFSYSIANDREKANITANKKRNAAFNSENFLGPLQYSDMQKNDAQLYYRYLTNIASPPIVIALGTSTFYIPFAKDQTAEQQTEINLPDYRAGGIPYTYQNLKKDLNADAEYRNYKLNYRTQVAARTLFLSNILQSYLRRLPNVTTGSGNKSIAQIEHDEVYNDFDPKAMQNAPATTVNYQILMQLRKLNRQLDDIKNYQERTVLMQSVIGLMELSNKSDPMTERKIGKKIFCMIPANKKEQACKSNML